LVISEWCDGLAPVELLAGRGGHRAPDPDATALRHCDAVDAGELSQS